MALAQVPPPPALAKWPLGGRDNRALGVARPPAQCHNFGRRGEKTTFRTTGGGVGVAKGGPDLVVFG